MQNNENAWEKYYQKILSNPHRAQTEIAETLNSSGNNRAIDCGCGTGADIAFLSQKGYEVFGFDVHEDSVRICKERFIENKNVHITKSSFTDFNYPESGLILANASLFFCEPKDFAKVWVNINKSIAIGGVFCGDFIGFKDTWVTQPDIRVCPLTEEQVKDLFSCYRIEQFIERDSQDTTALGEVKHWHTYQVIAKKCI